ncbi:S8 family peptidase [Lysinibacillus odysseyi]|uniref:Peptidase S8 n=1 Tax=Lysinibacillus odysseyi 34hs-1 = NBRC 100172 TaxID=1220589 RepID=A0A0A3IHS5_9BACI|nr:S8 family peptidase [Lysinibacillus odysseyi]KGR84296.1 peptidase S8 [Lysinibacillus odysseyi 34hs-1 = NBRC 100172]
MKKMKSTLLSLLIAGAVINPVHATTMNGDSSSRNDDSLETFRVYVEANNPSSKSTLQAQYSPRWELTENGFSTDMNEKQFEALQNNKNFTVTKVPIVTLDTVDLENDNMIENEVTDSTIAARASQQLPWGIKAIYNNNNLTSTSGGSGINIAVLDTGVNTSHADLVNNVEQCKDFTGATTPINNSCTDRNGHGTHVAGTALADGGSDKGGVYGVAPDADLWAYKVLTDSGSGYSDDIAAAIRHAADQATATGTKTIISMSLGSSANNSLISSAVNYAYSKGVLVIAAAGNSGYAQGTIGYPGALPNAIAVAALENVQQNGTYRVADYSSRGYASTAGDYVIQQGDIEISAPGSSVYSTWYNGGYNTISGTSMATPHVSGLAAKIWAENPSWSHTQLRSNLQARAKAVDIKGGYGAATGDDYASGFGFARVQ